MRSAAWIAIGIATVAVIVSLLLLVALVDRPGEAPPSRRVLYAECIADGHKAYDCL